MLSQLVKNIEREKSHIIYNNKIDPIQDSKKRKEYSLKQNCFDPKKMSPPNMFLIKLRERMNIYN